MKAVEKRTIRDKEVQTTSIAMYASSPHMNRGAQVWFADNCRVLKPARLLVLCERVWARDSIVLEFVPLASCSFLPCQTNTGR
jgi:hypothetical protein